MTDPADRPSDTDHLRALHRLAFITTVVVFITVAAGSFVRAAGAGLGCHSWPKCFEWSWFPPTSMEQVPEAQRALISIPKAWIEYLNRLVGATLGVFILATWWRAHRTLRQRRDIYRPLVWSVALVVFEGALGGVVVRYHLDPRLVTLHLFGGLLLAVLMVIATANARLAVPYVHRPNTWSPERKQQHAYATGLLALVLGNELVGALVRGTLETIEKTRPDLTRCQWIDLVGGVDWVHRKLALATLLLVFLLAWAARKYAAAVGDGARSIAYQNAALAVFQIAAGIVLAYAGLPPAAQVIHVTCGVLLVGNLVRHILVLRHGA